MSAVPFLPTGAVPGPPVHGSLVFGEDGKLRIARYESGHRFTGLALVKDRRADPTMPGLLQIPGIGGQDLELCIVDRELLSIRG